MTGQTDTKVKKRRVLIAVGVLLLALCAGGAYLALKAQGDAKNVKEDIAKDKTVATIAWTFAAGNAHA